MPCRVTRKHHRFHGSAPLGLGACVARPVGKQEIEREPAARAARDKEWANLWQGDVWDASTVREWGDVSREAQKTNRTIHLGRLFGIMVQKGSELSSLPDSDPMKKNMKFKYRVVFQGNNVVDQNWEVALFQDLGSSPATMEAGKAVDCHGCAPGHDVEQADAVQAYIQAPLSGTETWVHLPIEAWPAEWHGKFTKPVVLFKKALYGHPDSGTYWEKHCDTALRAGGYKPVINWPSCYYHSDLQLMLAVYVDDFKLSGPKENLKKGWDLIMRDSKGNERLKIESPAPANLYLGCTHEVKTISHADGHQSRAMVYNMESYLTSTVEKYCDLVENLTGDKVILKQVATPFLIEDNKDAAAGRPATSGGMPICPWCKIPCVKTTGTTSGISGDDERHHAAGAPSKPGKKKKMDAKAKSEKDELPDRGALQPIAASILMKILYAARMARFDLLRATCRLACYITKWTEECDKRLLRLIRYIHCSKGYRQIGWVGDPLSELTPHLYADADFAGCADTQRSTSGVHLSIEGPNSNFPINGSLGRDFASRFLYLYITRIIRQCYKLSGPERTLR
jgi:hypothetical protein